MDCFEVDKQRDFCILQMDLSEKQYLLDTATINVLMKLLAQNSKESRSIILTANTKQFCVGLTSNTAQTRLYSLLALLKALPIPIICIAKGKIAGAGFDILLASDISYVAESLVWVPSPSPVLSRKISNSSFLNAKLVSQQPLSADECLELGMVTRVYTSYAQAVREAIGLSVKIAEKSPLVIAGVKRVLNYSEARPVQSGLDYVARWNGWALNSPDLTKVVLASLSGAVPVFAKL